MNRNSYKGFWLVLVCSVSTYGQSFFDTSIAGGMTLDRQSSTAIEMRYNIQVFNPIYVSASMNLSLTGLEHNQNIYPRIGTTIDIKDRWTITGGCSIESRTESFWYYPYARIDGRLFSIDNQSIGMMVDIQTDRAMVGISFKEFRK
jgi:hypothetical protein